MQGSARTATTSATTHPHALQQGQQHGKSREPAINFIVRFITRVCSLENSIVF